MSNNNMTTIDGGIYNMDEGTVKKAPTVDLDVANKNYVDTLLKNYKKSRIGIVELFPVTATVGDDYAIEAAEILAENYPDAAEVLGVTYKSYGILDLSHLTSNTSDPEFQIAVTLEAGITDTYAANNMYKAFNGDGLTCDWGILRAAKIEITGAKAVLMVNTMFRNKDDNDSEVQRALKLSYSTTLSGTLTSNLSFQPNYVMSHQEGSQIATSNINRVEGTPANGDTTSCDFFIYKPVQWGTLKKDNKFSFTIFWNYSSIGSNTAFLNNFKFEITSYYDNGIQYLDIPSRLHPVSQVYSMNQEIMGILYIGDKITN